MRVALTVNMRCHAVNDDKLKILDGDLNFETIGFYIRITRQCDLWAGQHVNAITLAVIHSRLRIGRYLVQDSRDNLAAIAHPQR